MDRRKLAELARAIEDDPPDLPDPMARLVAPLRDAFAFDVAASYCPEVSDDGIEARFIHANGARADDIVDATRGVIGSTSRWGAFDPRRPETAQRNRSRCFDPDEFAATPMGRATVPAGLEGMYQLRVLVCDGPLLLGWVGGFRVRPYEDTDLAALEVLAERFRRRLWLDRQLGEAARARGALDVVLDAIDAPAVVLTSSGAIAHANRAARAVSADRWKSFTRDVRDAVRAPHPPYDVTPIRDGRASHHLVVVRAAPEGDATARLDSFARRYGLTPRETDVVALVVRGEANKAIADRLGCSIRTVELHVTASLRKTSTATRTELVATFWDAS